MTSEMSEAPASTARPATTAPEQRDNGSGNLSAGEQIDLVVPPVEYTTRFASPTDLNISLRSGYGADRPDVPRGERRQPMRGFEDTYVDIVDYIVRITHRIWEDQDVGYIYDTYAPGCRVFDDAGLRTAIGIVALIAHDSTSDSTANLIILDA
jgi:hypothetical protein